MAGPGGSKRAGFSATATVNRKDFGIEWNKTFDEGGTLLGDDVEVEIEIEAVQKAPDTGGTK
jgi:polyisoprenoid-binding protein YceI